MKRAKRPLRRAYAHDARLAVRNAQGVQVAATGPQWVTQHQAPPRHIRRAWAAIIHDRSGKSRVRAVARLFGTDAVTASTMLDGADWPMRNRTPPLANDAAAHEAMRAGLKVPYSGGRSQAIAMNEIPVAKKRKRAIFLAKREIREALEREAENAKAKTVAVADAIE